MALSLHWCVEHSPTLAQEVLLSHRLWFQHSVSLPQHLTAHRHPCYRLPLDCELLQGRAEALGPQGLAHIGA